MKRREIQVRVEECQFCDHSTEDYCERHQGMIDELPKTYMVGCGECGELAVGVPKNGRVKCMKCDKLLMAPKGEIHG